MATKDDRGPYRARFVADVEGYTGLLGTLYRNEYNDGLFEVNDGLRPEENCSFDPDEQDLPGLLCGLVDVELLEE
jgi:hypothetical protein